MKFLSVDECISKLLQFANDLPVQQTDSFFETPLLQATNLTLAEDIISTIDVPPADNSAMDGYAVHYADTKKSLTISQKILAGAIPQALSTGTAARIFTGAEIPEGADTVIMQENCIESNGLLTFTAPIKLGDNIRKQGQDIAQGTTIIKKGMTLRAQEIGLLASIGITTVKTRRPLKVAIINTGNELIEPGQTLQTGQIYNSNRFLLDSILNGWGFETTHSTIVSDSLEETKKALLTMSQQNDIIITTGGVSVGDEDYIKPAVSELGTLDLWKVAIKPGKPFAFGNIANTPFIGLPGNPASAFVTLLVLARPYLFKQQGIADQCSEVSLITSTANFNRKSGSRDEYLRANLKDGLINIYPNQSSGVLTSASWGNCLALQTANTTIKVGDSIPIYLYKSLLSK